MKITTGYNSIGHLPESRLGKGDHSVDNACAKKFTDEFPKDKKCMLYVEEKMDGSNCSVIRINGEIKAVTRTGYDCSVADYEQYKMFHRWVMKNKDKFEALLPDEGDRAIGEWCAMAHGTVYENLKDPYFIFELRLQSDKLPSIATITKSGHKWLNALINATIEVPVTLRRSKVEAVGLVNVPLVYEGEKPISVEEALKLVPANAEGLVYKLEVKVKSAECNSPYMKVKFVRKEKIDGLYLVEGSEIWNWKE